MPTIFSQIITRKIPAFIVAEDEEHIAFLDISPMQRGHTLVVLKEEVDYLFSLSAAKISRLMAFAQKVALAIEEAVPCKRIAMAVLGLEVPHVHIHLVPLHQARDFDFKSPKIAITQKDMATIAQAITEAFTKRNKQVQ